MRTSESVLVFMCSMSIAIGACESNSEPKSPAEKYRMAMEALDTYAGHTRKLMLAMKLCSSILEQNPNSAPAYVCLGRATYKNSYRAYSDYDPDGLWKSYKLLDKAIDLDPKLADAYIYKAHALLNAKDLPRAKDAVAKAEKLQPDSLKALQVRARIANGEENWQSAIEIGERIIASAEDNNTKSKAYSSLTKAFRKTNRLQDADQAFRKIVDLEPYSAWAKANYANFLYNRKRDDEAIAMAELALAQMDSPIAHEIIADASYRKARSLYWDQKKYVESAAYFEKAVKNNPNNADAFYGLGLALREKARRNRSVELLEQSGQAFRDALKADPHHELSQKELAQHEKHIHKFRK